MLVNEIYGFVLIYLVVSLIVVFVLYVISYLVSEKKINLEKLSIYECGFEPVGSNQVMFDIKFYIVSLLFVIFDLEVVFIFPWAINLTSLGLLGYYSMLFFLLVLTLGFVYEYKKGALEW